MKLTLAGKKNEEKAKHMTDKISLEGTQGGVKDERTEQCSKERR